MVKRVMASTGFGALLMLGAGMIPEAAAEAADAGLRPIDEIVVVAPRIRQERDRRAGTSRITTISRDIRVDFSDLDLKRTTDLYVLEERVNEAAREVCEDLAEIFPHAQPSVAVCIRRAVEDAMVQVREAAQRAVAS